MYTNCLERGEFIVALIGNPNVGKSAIFNDLTGGMVYVANWPGVTVELKYGETHHHNIRIKIVDLPGTYSLVMGDESEKIVRDYIFSNKPDVYLVITDVTSLERTLYPAIKLLEASSKVVIALNMYDIARRRALHINIDALSKSLGTYLVPTSALTGEGLGVLLDRILDKAMEKDQPLTINYGPLEPYIHKLTDYLKSKNIQSHLPLRWIAIEILESDNELREFIVKKYGLDSNYITSLLEEIKANLRIDPAIHIIRTRYDFISSILKDRVITTRLIRPRWMERLDGIFLNPKIGPMFSLMVLFIGFLTIFVINTGFPLNILFKSAGLLPIAELLERYSLVELMDLAIGYLGNLIVSLLTLINAPPWITDFIVNGLVAGVGAVLSFLPLIFLVFILNAFLQDTGLYTRIAVSLHNFFRHLGLSGKSIYPAIVGFGCNVPAILSTRSLDNDAERITVSLSIPFIPCQARLVVLLALTSAISNNPLIQSLTILFLYLISIVIYLLTAKLISKLLFNISKGPDILMELPPYHIPHPRVIWWFSKFHTLAFLKKAGTVILAIILIVWTLLHLSPIGYLSEEMLASSPELLASSYAAIVGKFLEPLASPIGLADWRAILSLEAGFIAKEAVIGVIVSTAGIDNPILALKSLSFTPLQIFILAIFMTIYTPCIPTVVSMKSEVKKWKYIILIVIYELFLAYIISFIIYNIGLLLI